MAHLRSHFNSTSVDGMSTEGLNNFLNAPGVVTLIRNMDGNLKVWGHLAGARDAFPKIRMAQIELPALKKMSQMCLGRVLVLLHPLLM